MPRIFPAPPNPQRQAFLDYVSRLQEQRYREEQERAQERERQRQRAIIAGGVALGALGGLALAPAAVASSAATGAAITATGASATGAAISAGLTGASIGGQIAQQFAGGDIAGGVTTAAGAARGIIQAQEDQQLYGGSITAKERALYTQAALKADLNPVQLKAMAMQTGQTIPELIQTAQIQQADVKQLDALARDLDLGVTGAFLKEKGAEYPGGQFGLIQDLRGEQAEFETQVAGQRAYSETTGRRDAEAAAAASREQMELRFDPREVSQRSADLNFIDAALSSGDFTLEQATRMKAALPRLTPTLVPRRTPINIGEVAAQQSATVPITVDGKVVDHAFVSLDRDGRIRYHASVADLRGKGAAPGVDFATAMSQLTLPQQMKLMSDASQQAFLGGDRDVTAPEAAIRVEQNYDALQMVLGGQAAQRGAPGTPAPPAQRATQAFDALLQRVNQKPLDTWSDQELALAGETIDAIVLDIEQSGSKDPNLLAMLAQALEFSDLINARRNR